MDSTRDLMILLNNTKKYDVLSENDSTMEDDTLPTSNTQGLSVNKKWNQIVIKAYYSGTAVAFGQTLKK